MRRYLIGGRSVWGTREGKNYKKKGYFESADELLSLKNNLSLYMTMKTRNRRVFVVYAEKTRTLKKKQEKYIFE